MYKKKSNRHLIVAVLIGVVFNGISMFFTLEDTYDALIHLFFANHYATSWFEPWNYSWYTGFTMMSYPPLTHQVIALLSYIWGLKFGLFIVALFSVVLYITGVYRFSLLITINKTTAGYTAILAALSSSFIESFHIFGQLPSILGISILLHALPEIYRWLITGKHYYLITSLSLIGVMVTTHHVTPIFGMVFFIFPLIGMVLMDVSLKRVDTIKQITLHTFFKSFRICFKRIISFGILSIGIIIVCLLPYWINSKNNPITQVPIPHGSRDNFIEITSSGLVFFLIPWGVLLFILPYIVYRYFSKRLLFFGISIMLLAILGTGSTTPIPRLILGDMAFNILTLDRFTFWASIIALPMFGEFMYRFIEGDYKELVHYKFGVLYHRISGGILIGLFLFMAVFTITLGYYRPMQPQKIKMLPIINFLNQDQHYKWRYLTLGFGDQMAWLSAQTRAQTVDGNYHSARRLPELTTRAVERLENSKFKGVEGIGSLQQFLTVPEKYHLKYIFSNDKFYDPILFFCGWQRLLLLENGIMVWEKLNVPPLSSILPKEEIPKWQKIMWGIVPLLTVVITFIVFVQIPLIIRLKKQNLLVKRYLNFESQSNYKSSKKIVYFLYFWSLILIILICFGTYKFYIYNNSHYSPENVLKAYYNAVDFKEFEKAHSLLDPQSNISISQYMLEKSVTGGLLNSYAKLDEIQINITSKNDSMATAMVQTNWITPLEKINIIDYESLIKFHGKWYIVPENSGVDLPPNQLITVNTTSYFNQGRRRITTEQTYHEDVLKQPVIEVISAKLIKNNDEYVIIGEIQNIDNVPADIVLKAVLYNNANKELVSYNAKYHVKHKLMPKETSSFRINFERTAWLQLTDSIPNTFDPNQYTSVFFKELPVNFNLYVGGNMSGSDLYKNSVLNDITINGQSIEGSLFNNGINEITIPQLLITYYDINKKMVWVDNLFLKESIRQQRKLDFKYKLLPENNNRVISTDMSHCFVNGLSNEYSSKKIVPNRIKNHTHPFLQPINHKAYSYIKIELNSYISNP